MPVIWPKFYISLVSQNQPPKGSSNERVRAPGKTDEGLNSIDACALVCVERESETLIFVP